MSASPNTARIALRSALAPSITSRIAGIDRPSWSLLRESIAFGVRSWTGSIDPFLWLLPGALRYTCLRIFTIVLFASDSPARVSLGPTAALVTRVAFDLILIPFSGAVGAAIAASLAFFAGG